MAVRKNHRGSKKQQLSNDAGGLFSAAGVDFAVGCGYFALITNLWLGKGMSAGAILYSTFLIFVPADTLLMVLAAFLGSRLLPILRREQLISH